MSENEILAKIKAHDSGINVRKIMCNNPKIDLRIKNLVKSVICSKDNKRKQKFCVN